MNSPHWAVALDGKPFDVEDARELFGQNTSVGIVDIVVPPERNITALLADEFDGCDSEQAVNEAAERLLSLINGVLFARDPDRSPLSHGAVHRKGADGRWSPGTIFAFCAVQIGPVRMRATATVSHADGTLVAPETPRPPDMVRWLAATLDDTALDVLHMLRGNPGWFDLFMAFERMRDDINKRLPRGADPSTMGWPNKRDTGHFTQSAQVHRHSRAKWPPGYNLDTAMPYNEARAFLSGLVRMWLEWRSSLGREEPATEGESKSS